MLFGLALLAGCAAFPTQGPYPISVGEGEVSTPERLGYVLVDLQKANIPALDNATPVSLGMRFRSRSPAPTLLLGVGDIVNVTIFEAASGGLFIPAEAGARAGNFVTIPNQEIDRAGTIAVPFAGQVPAAGRSLAEVKATIEERLRNRAIEPQAVVTLQEARSTLVTVTGEVNLPTRFPLTRTSDRILDAVTRAGGSKWAPYESYVTLTRGGRTGRVYFNRLINDPSNNIFLMPGDTISVAREIRSILALGASGQNGFINFEAETQTLSQAIARAGGILDSRGDPAQTFIYRLESRDVVRHMGYDTSQFDGKLVPVIYRVDLRNPEGFFLAGRFQMRDKDILFVSNAPTVELAKFLQLIALSANTAGDAEAVRIILKGGRL